MSQALFERAANGRHQSRSAGTRPADHVHPVVADAMREVGIDVSGNRPQKLTDDLGQWADIIVTMGCGDECPYIPGKKYIDWDLTDPVTRLCTNSTRDQRTFANELGKPDLAGGLDVRDPPAAVDVDQRVVVIAEEAVSGAPP